MLLPISEQDTAPSAPPAEFDGHYRRLKNLVNEVLRKGIPIQDLHLIPKVSS